MCYVGACVLQTKKKKKKKSKMLAGECFVFLFILVIFYSDRPHHACYLRRTQLPEKKNKKKPYYFLKYLVHRTGSNRYCLQAYPACFISEQTLLPEVHMIHITSLNM